MSPSKPSDDLGLAYRAAARQPSWPGPDCPPAEALERLAAGAAEPDERRRLADHLVECSQCAALVRELRDLGGWAARVVRQQRRPVPDRRWPLALAASLVLAAGLAYVASAPRPSTETVRGASVALSPPVGATLARPPARFSWPEQPGASGYRVELRNAAGETVWLGPWELGASAELPAEIAARLEPGTYLWQLELRGAALRSRLGPFVFVLGTEHGK